MRRLPLAALCIICLLAACSFSNPAPTGTTSPLTPVTPSQTTAYPPPSATAIRTVQALGKTRIPAGCRFSSVSPNFDWIIYTCGNKLWLAKMTDLENAALVIQDDHLIGTSWSSDGVEFAVGIYYPNPENTYLASLWVYKRDTPSERRLLYQGEFFCDRQLWSPSGKWILVAGGGGKSSNAIFIRTDGTGRESLAPIGIMNWWNGASWSPNSAHLAYASDERFGEAKDLDVDTGIITNVYSSTGSSLFMPAWSPDGKMIAILADSYPARLVVVNSASKRVLNDLTLPTNWKQSTDLFWSPDSKRIAISYFLDGYQIGIVSLPSGEASELPGEELWPILGWSKDGLVGFGAEGGKETIETIPAK